MAERPLPSPLPADLPENWALDQIVAPDGTSVGLTQQHGYNYLMKQVNAAHRGVNAINESFDTISGKRTCRFVVGTSVAGWTEADCDYLCDGVDDQDEIQTAINAVPSSGGEIVLLDGTYQLSAHLTVKATVVLRGAGMNTTVLSMKEGAFDGEEGAAVVLYGSIKDLCLYNFVSGTGSGKFLLKTSANNVVSDVRFRPDTATSCIFEDSETLVVTRCLFYSATPTILTGEARKSMVTFFGNHIRMSGKIALKGLTVNDSPKVLIFGNNGNNLRVELDAVNPESIVACNQLDQIQLLNTSGDTGLSKGCLIAANNFAYVERSACMILGANTSYNFVTGNQCISLTYGTQRFIQDSGQNNVVRFNSNDTGGSGGASGVTSFNGRTGTVTPQAGDYTAGMVGARPDTWTPTAADVGAVTGQGVQTIQAMTQEEYDALTEKSGTTMYIIKE